MHRHTYGDRDACQRCGQDIEFHGQRQWRDRGGDRFCQLLPDRTPGNHGSFVKPTRKILHKPLKA